MQAHIHVAAFKKNKNATEKPAMQVSRTSVRVQRKFCRSGRFFDRVTCKTGSRGCIFAPVFIINPFFIRIMMNHVDYKLVPMGYAHCFNASCPRSGECLRHWAAGAATVAPEQIAVVNPRRIASADSCPYFRCAQPVRMARGFRNALATVPSGQVKNVASAISRLYNQRYYYRMRRGEYALAPAQQEVISGILAAAGASLPIAFDYYETALDW